MECTLQYDDLFYTLSSLSEAGVNAIGSKSPTLIFLDVKSGFTM